MNSQDLKFANFFQRFAARLIDVIIVSILVWPLSHFLSDKEPSAYNYENYKGMKSVIGILLFYLLYYPILEGSGGTLGKQILSIKSVSADTLKPISFGQSYKRSLLLSWPIFISFIVGFFAMDSGFYPEKTIMFLIGVFVLFGIVGPLAVLWSKHKQGWHDVWANTYVVRS